MSNYAKRLCDAWVGATVLRVAPHACLWSPSFRAADGFGVDPDIDGSLVLQCSWAAPRQNGPSTRISRALVQTYATCAPLTAWRPAVRFVLVGSDEPSLFAVRLIDLSELVAKQERGTVNAETLRALQSLQSLACDRPVAEPLESVIEEWARSSGPRREHRPTLEDVRVSPGYAEGSAFGFHRPAPLAVRF